MADMKEIAKDLTIAIAGKIRSTSPEPANGIQDTMPKKIKDFNNGLAVEIASVYETIYNTLKESETK